jgi:hypothetical protein
MAQRLDAGLCYNCPAKYSKEHVKECTMKGIYLLEIADDAPAEDSETDEPRVSLSAITGISSSATMHMGVSLANTSVRALVDSGSTHCFVAKDTARRLGLAPVLRPGMSVAIANGDHVPCDGVCTNVPICIDTECFDIDVFVIALEGYEMVLGCQWLRTLGPILWDFDRMSMSFWRADHRVQWFGLDASHLHRINAVAADNLLQLLLAEFADLFAIPEGLPPRRALDHRIHLLPNTPPVAVRPYRYPQLLKDEIERQCADMLQHGII